MTFEAPSSKLQGIFDCKEAYHFEIRSLALQQAAGNALAVAVQLPSVRKPPGYGKLTGHGHPLNIEGSLFHNGTP
ncbi:MAG: hypothetical protein JRJ47_14100 [Deltaproteobacteria bacterium]|nr:hypothetical protein [Deltaproteobacteria bacterium]